MCARASIRCIPITARWRRYSSDKGFATQYTNKKSRDQTRSSTIAWLTNNARQGSVARTVWSTYHTHPTFVDEPTDWLRRATVAPSPGTCNQQHSEVLEASISSPFLSHALQTQTHVSIEVSSSSHWVQTTIFGCEVIQRRWKFHNKIQSCLRTALVPNLRFLYSTGNTRHSVELWIKLLKWDPERRFLLVTLFKLSIIVRTLHHSPFTGIRPTSRKTCCAYPTKSKIFARIEGYLRCSHIPQVELLT